MAGGFRQVGKGLASLGRGFTNVVQQGMAGAEELGGMIKRRGVNPMDQRSVKRTADNDRRSPESIVTRQEQKANPTSPKAIDDQIAQIRLQMADPDYQKNKGVMADLNNQLQQLTARKPHRCGL